MTVFPSRPEDPVAPPDLHRGHPPSQQPLDHLALVRYRWRSAVVPRSRLGRRAADGQQPTAVGINTTLGEPWRIVGAAGR
jgi:hypothetical protein